MDPETLKLVLTTCAGPAVLALMASAATAVWYIFKLRAIGQEKREDAGYTYNLAKETSIRAFGEGVKTREAEQLNEITSAALKQIYGLTDGTLTDIRNKIAAGNIEQAIQDARILSDMSAYQAIMSASLNKTIEQNARILGALLELLGQSSAGNIPANLTAEILAALTAATITSRSVQKADEVAAAATAGPAAEHGTSPPASNEPGESTIEVTGKTI